MHWPLLFPGLVCLILCSGCLGLVSDEVIETNLIVSVDQERLTIETSMNNVTHLFFTLQHSLLISPKQPQMFRLKRLESQQMMGVLSP